jgi:hypothetical protein
MTTVSALQRPRNNWPIFGLETTAASSLPMMMLDAETILCGLGGEALLWRIARAPTFRAPYTNHIESGNTVTLAQQSREILARQYLFRLVTARTTQN